MMKKLLLIFALMLAVPLGLLAQGSTWSSATQLPLGQDKSGQLSKDRTEDWWTFTVGQDGAATITVTPGSGLRVSDVRLYYYEYASDGTPVNYWTRSDNNYWMNPGWYQGSFTAYNLAPGSYLVRVERGEGADSYTINCSFTANSYANNSEVDDWNNANTLPKDTPKQGHLGYGYAASGEDNYDWWVFTVTEDGQTTINIKHEISVRISDMRLFYYEYAADGAIVNYWTRSDNSYWVNPGWYEATLTIPNMLPGKYLIRIERGEAQGGYELTYTHTPCTYTVDKEPNDWNDAHTLPLNTPKQGHMGYGYAASSEDNYDWWTFEVKQDGAATIDISHESSLRISDVRLFYYEYGDGQPVKYWTRSDNTCWMNPGWYSGSIRVPNLAPGTYLIRIQRGEGQGGYELTSTFEPQEYTNDNEPNNDWDKGLVRNYLARGQEKQAHLGYGYAASSEDDYDFFRITVPRDGTVSLVYTPTSVNSALRVSDVRFYYIEYASDTHQPVNYWARTDNAYWMNPGWYAGTLTIPNVAPGDYLVRVQRGEGSGAYSLKYEFTQNSLPNNPEPDDWNKATALPEGTTLSGHLGYGYVSRSEDNYDWYTVTMAKAGTLKVNIQPESTLRISDLRLYYYEYDKDGNIVNYWARTKGNYFVNPGWYAASLTTENVDAGTYLIRVERGEGQGNYRISFNADLADVEPLKPLEDEGVGQKNCFVVWLSDTEKHVYPLSEKPMVTMANGLFTLSTINTTVTYQHDKVVKFTLTSDETVGIEQVEEQRQPTVERFADHVVISGSKANSPVSIYNMSGRLVGTQRTDGTGYAEVQLSQLPAGIYVVKTEHVTIKIAKR